MPENTNDPNRPDWNTHVANRKLFPWEELQKYRDQWIAWSADGTRIVAHHRDPLEVIRQVEEAGLSTEDVQLSFQPDDEGDAWL